MHPPLRGRGRRHRGGDASRSSRYGCEIISDPGVIPVKFRAPGGTVCEIVPKGRYKKPATRNRPRSQTAPAARAECGERMASKCATSGGPVVRARAGRARRYIVVAGLAGNTSAPTARARDSSRCGTASRWSRCRWCWSCSSARAQPCRRRQAIDWRAIGRALTVWLALAVSRRACQARSVSCVSFALLTLLHRRGDVPPPAQQSAAAVARRRWRAGSIWCSRWRSALRCRPASWGSTTWKSCPACCRASRSRCSR